MRAKLRVPHEVAALVRGLHPDIKKKVRAALESLLADPLRGKPLREELEGLRSLRVARFRIVYRIAADGTIEVIALGPRRSIYEETLRLLRRPRRRSP